MTELTWKDVRAARQDIDSLIYSYSEAAGLVADIKWEADHPNPEDGDYADFNRSETIVTALRQLLPVIREAMSKHSPDIYAAVLKAEAYDVEQRAEYAAQNLAKAKAKGFETYEAMIEARDKARRSASAKKAAATRKENAAFMERMRIGRAAREAETINGPINGPITLH